MDRIPGGYIIIAKKITDSEIWNKPPLYLKVWLYLLQRAQFKEYKNLKKGQLFVTIRDIQENCSWFVGCRKSTPTKDQIFQILDWMRKPSVSLMEATTKATMITTTKATHGILITIDNYCVYQNPKLYESNAESNNETDTKATGEQRTANNINKEGTKNTKKVKNNKNIYGAEENVLLTATEYERLKNEYDCADAAIEFLSSYMVEKGYDSKDHNRTIRRWVIDAVKKNKTKGAERNGHDRVHSFGDKSDSGSGNKGKGGVPEDFWVG